MRAFCALAVGFSSACLQGLPLSAASTPGGVFFPPTRPILPSLLPLSSHIGPQRRREFSRAHLFYFYKTNLLSFLNYNEFPPLPPILRARFKPPARGGPAPLHHVIHFVGRTLLFGGYRSWSPATLTLPPFRSPDFPFFPTRTVAGHPRYRVPTPRATIFFFTSVLPFLPSSWASCCSPSFTARFFLTWAPLPPLSHVRSSTRFARMQKAV